MIEEVRAAPPDGSVCVDCGTHLTEPYYTRPLDDDLPPDIVVLICESCARKAIE